MPSGKHPHNALTPARVRALVVPGRYADGGGLYLIVDEGGAKRWLLRTVIRGARRDIGIGSARLVSLADAREEARAMRALARKGGDPLQARRMERRPVPTFREAAKTVHVSHTGGWRSPKHAAQWITTVETYACPEFGDRPINSITTADVLKVLGPIWQTKPETARRLRQRIGTVMDWARASGFLTAGNPVEGVTKGLPKQREARGHHAALPFSEVPDFVCRVRASDAGEIVRSALEFLILVAARTGEVIGARWDEVDVAGRIWTVPASRMKAQREHRVPLSDRALEILKRAKLLASGSDYIFPGATGGPLSNMVFLMLLRRMGDTCTVHGFRSAFRDWASEKTNFSRDVCEMALAHTVRDKTEAAYRRGDLFEKRAMLMASWADHIEPDDRKVVQFRA